MNLLENCLELDSIFTSLLRSLGLKCVILGDLLKELISESFNLFLEYLFSSFDLISRLHYIFFLQLHLKLLFFHSVFQIDHFSRLFINLH
jgi:hypothetical protein